MKEPTYVIPIQTLQPGTRYHLHIECTEIVATQWNGNSIDIGIFSVGDIDKAQVIDVDFQVDSTVSEIELHAPVGSGDYCIWRRCLVCLSADWQALQALDVNWFTGDAQSPQHNTGLVFPLDFGQSGNMGNTGMISNNGSYIAMPVITVHGNLDSGLTIHWNTSDGNEGDLSFNGNVGNVPVTINTDTHSAIMGGLDVSYLLGSRDWPRIPAGGSCSFALLASGSGWVSVQSHDTYM